MGQLEIAESDLALREALEKNRQTVTLALFLIFIFCSPSFLLLPTYLTDLNM